VSWIRNAQQWHARTSVAIKNAISAIMQGATRGTHGIIVNVLLMIRFVVALAIVSTTALWTKNAMTKT
jgi:hypothetical protein